MGRPPWLVPVAAAYLLMLLALTLLPWPGQATDPTHPFLRLRVWGTIGPALADGFDLATQADRLVVGNVLAFVPLGVLWPLLRPSPRASVAVLAVGLVLSLAIELSQLGVTPVIGYPYRQADVDDVLLNTSGALVGYGAFSLRRAWKQVPRPK